MELKTIRSGMAYAIWEHAADRYDPNRKKLGPDRAVPAPAIHAARDLEHLLLKMNCVTTLEELLTPGLDTDLGDFGYRLAKDALRVKYTGYQIGVLTPTLHAKIEEHARRKGDPIGAELEWHGEIELGIEGESHLDMESIRQGPGPTVRRVKNPRGAFTAKGERMYEHVKHSEHGSPRAKEIAARTVYARAEEGAPGLLANPALSEWGFDLTVFRPGGFQNVLRALGIPPSSEAERGSQGWEWNGYDVSIVTGNNPITGEAGPMSIRAPEVDYAGYIGIRGSKEKVAIAKRVIKQNADYIKDDVGTRGLIYIGFGDDEHHHRRARHHRRNPDDNPSRWPASEVQSLLFDKTVFTAHQAKEWAREHGRPPGVPQGR